jgi:hypothetical protein
MSSHAQNQETYGQPSGQVRRPGHNAADHQATRHSATGHDSDSFSDITFNPQIQFSSNQTSTFSTSPCPISNFVFCAKSKHRTLSIHFTACSLLVGQISATPSQIAGDFAQ